MTQRGLRLVEEIRTDVGKVREHNEDSLLHRPEAGLWAVADGMGGLERGEWASAEIVAALQAAPLSGDFDDDCRRAADAIHAANSKIHAESETSGDRMGSTVVSLLVNGRRFAVLWAGDSRAYLLRDGQLHRLSRDHTQVQELVDEGLLSPDDAVNHPMSHVLTRAAGVEPGLELDAIADEAEVGDVFLLCSDGLHGVVSDAEIALTLGMERLPAACDRLIQLSLARGGPDNVTLVAVGCEEATLLSLAPSEA
jgi:serine/threonine protein phosphatase PrpC